MDVLNAIPDRDERERGEEGGRPMSIGKSEVHAAPGAIPPGVTGESVKAKARPVSESFDRARFEAALKKMDATTDETDTDETWDAIMAGIRAARHPAGEGS